MAYKKLKYPYDKHPTNAEMLADVVLRAADKRELIEIDPEREFAVSELLNLCRCLGTPGKHPWPSYTPYAKDDEALLAHGLLYASIAMELIDDQLAIEPRDGFYAIPTMPRLIELGRKLSEEEVGFGLYDAPELVATYEDLASLSVEAVYDDGENCSVVEPGSRVNPNLYSIYAVNKQGMSQCVGDFRTAAQAFRCAGEIAKVAADKGANLAVFGGLRRWCLLDALRPSNEAASALRNNYLSFLRTDKIPYRAPQLAALAMHEQNLSGATVSEWMAEVGTEKGSFHAPYPMIAVDAITHEDQRVYLGKPAVDADDLRTCIWVINPEMRDEAVKIARDLLHYGEAAIDVNQAGLIVKPGERHRLKEMRGPTKTCRINISPLGRGARELDDMDLGEILSDAADAFMRKDETLGISRIYEENWLVVGGIGVLPSTEQGHITIEFETNTGGFMRNGVRNEIAHILNQAADEARAGKEGFELLDTVGNRVGRLRRTEATLYYLSRSTASTFITEALAAIKSNSHDGELTARLVAQRAGYDSYPNSEMPMSFEEFPELKQSFEHGARAAAKERGVVEQDMQPSM